MSDNEQVSHGDIYHKLGNMEGKLESILMQLAEKRSDVNNLFARVREVENKLAWAMGVVAVCSILVPMIVTSLAPKIHLPSAPNGSHSYQQN